MTHDPDNCPLCAKLRHPSTGMQARILKAHLEKYPLPRQTKKEK